MSNVHFSSKTDLWSTPQDLFDELNKEFNFTLDVCATPDNAKCKRFFTKETDGLSCFWEGSVWMNPPYGREIGKWIKKAHESTLQSFSGVVGNGAIVVCLIPARTDTKWWHEYVMKHEIRFIKGRLKFGEAKTNAPFPSAIVVMRPSHDKNIMRSM